MPHDEIFAQMLASALLAHPHGVRHEANLQAAAFNLANAWKIGMAELATPGFRSTQTDACAQK